MPTTTTTTEYGTLPTIVPLKGTNDNKNDDDQDEAEDKCCWSSWFTNLGDIFTSQRSIYASPRHEPDQPMRTSLWFPCFLLMMLLIFILLYLVFQQKHSVFSTIPIQQLFLVPPWVLDLRQKHDNFCPTTLILLRHAKSSRDDPSAKDFDRPLAAKGIQSALKLGRYLNRHDVPPPDCIVASPSNRTLSTLALVQQEWRTTNDKTTIPIEFRQELYDDALTSYVGFLMHEMMDLASNSYLKACSQSACHRLLLVGHNPAIGKLAATLVPSVTTHFPTGGYCEFHLKRNWWDALLQQEQQQQEEEHTTTATNNGITETNNKKAPATIGICTTL